MLDARQVAAVKVGLRMLEEVLSFERSKTSCLVDYEKKQIWVIMSEEKRRIPRN